VLIRSDEQGAILQLFNGLGQAVVVPQERSGNTIVFDVATLPAGAYHVVILGAQPITTRFLKE
jgi:hypothetical protein